MSTVFATSLPIGKLLDLELPCHHTRDGLGPLQKRPISFVLWPSFKSLHFLFLDSSRGLTFFTEFPFRLLNYFSISGLISRYEFNTVLLYSFYRWKFYKVLLQSISSTSLEARSLHVRKTLFFL